MTVYDYWSLIRRGWLVLVAAGLIGMALAQAATVSMTPEYSSGSAVVVGTAGETGIDSLAQGSGFSTERARTYAGLATSTAVLGPAAATLGEDIASLRSAVSASARADTAIVDIQTRGNSGEAAAVRADAVAAALIEAAQTVDGPTGSLRMSVISSGVIPTAADSPRPVNNLLIGAVVGLSLAVAILIGAHAMDTRIRSRADLPGGRRLPEGFRVSAVSALPSKASFRPVPGVGTAAAATRREALRHLRASLQFSAEAQGVLAIADVARGAVAKEVADELAIVLGEIGFTAVVVDVDLRVHAPKGRQQAASGSGGAGMAELLTGDEELDDVLRQTESQGVWRVGAGAATPASAQHISTAPMREFLEEAASRFDYVLLACPPLNERSESSVVAALSTTVVLVVNAGSTKRGDFLRAAELLTGVGVASVSVAIDRLRNDDPAD